MVNEAQSFDCDLVIVGASFAGAACALSAASRGLRVVVLERKPDVGSRLHTTGIVVKEAAEQTLLGRAPADCFYRVEGVKLYSPALRSLSLSAPGYYFLTTDTPKLMRWLAEELVRHGVDLRLGVSFTQAVRDGEGWSVGGVGRTRYLVGADGAKSKVAELAGLGQGRTFLYGVEYEFPGMMLSEPEALHCFVSKRYAPGYIGWITQNPTGVQAGLAMRYAAKRRRAPDVDGFLRRVRHLLGVPESATPGATRAGLIPCGGPAFPLARDGVILTGDAAGIVSPVTAGGIHSAWMHGESVGRAIAAHVLAGGPAPERIATRIAPRYRMKRLLRWTLDHFQCDWPFELLLHSALLRRAAEQIYFHGRGTRMAVPCEPE